jgi:hypothetical protein
MMEDERMSHIGSSFSAVCSPPLSVMYKGRKRSSSIKLKKMEGQVDAGHGDSMDEDMWAGLLKISKSSEELWKEVCGAVSLVVRLMSVLNNITPSLSIQVFMFFLSTCMC